MKGSQRKELAGRGPVGKTAVVGAKDRGAKQIGTKAISSTDGMTLEGFVQDSSAATACTNEATARESRPCDHGTVKHSRSEFVKGEVHTNGIMSQWSMLGRVHEATFDKLSPRHSDCYERELTGRHNVLDVDTKDQVASILSGMESKRLTYKALMKDYGLASGATS